MDQLECEKILQVLDDESTNGISLMSLSRRTRIRCTQLHSFLRAHKKCFELIAGNSKYRISQQAPFHGNAGLIRAALQEENESRRLQENLAIGIVFFSVLMGLALTFFPIYVGSS